ncbi:tripartite tricarboxylate transporter TctB family protein [Murinocardiopsis flavida]|uniref:Tripartite tricarboxylate transporter TctB family protein n=1 Tax=Murinocardiopsis flavida TaxID=645275 RepID=A0A2P8D3P0_9ACTN|nr:tripartite tricarboxylate transporter TctB family protein [Murinocardiopsis flavida]PSK91838.1 tripartite tricarboxylate transporter TctB family protein [Murinocardiopsis flavida]
MTRTTFTWPRIPLQRRAAEPTRDGRTGAADRPAAPARRITGATVFYLIVTAVLIGYTAMAFGMDWRTDAGRIGPGYFPRILGVIGVALAALATIGSLRPTAAGPGEAAPRHPWPVAATCAGLAGFAAVMVPVGAIVTGALLLTGLLLLVDRTRPVRAAALGIGFPIALYVVFDILLNAALPSGVLPFL